jgi:hypothetical protein
MPTVVQGLGFLGDAVLLCGEIFVWWSVAACLSDRGWLRNTAKFGKANFKVQYAPRLGAGIGCAQHRARNQKSEIPNIDIIIASLVCWYT